MKRDDVFELIVKAFGVYLLVLAIIAIPKMLEGIIMLGLYVFQGPWGLGDDTMGKMMTTLQTTYISSSLGAVIRFAIYIIASINFLRSGSWVRRLMEKKLAAEQSPAGDDLKAAPEE